MISSLRTFCFVTGTRAEFGLLAPVIDVLRDTPDARVQIMAVGQHLSPQYGFTVDEIIQQGFTVDARVEMLMASDSGVSIAKAMSLGLSGMADALDRLRPDILIVLGDRFEILAACSAALALRIPIAHLHGGELTQGVIDDAIRHAVTKLSHLHFVSAEPYRKRVLQLGEEPERVFNTGAPGLDAIRMADTITKPELERELGLSLEPPVFVVTYHPVTLSPDETRAGANALVAALRNWPNASVVFTRGNADQEHAAADAMVDEAIAQAPERRRAVTSLGSRRYLSLLRCADVMIGNSSSGLYEAPFLRVPTVNIGSRQDGRLRAPSVLDCAPTDHAVTASIQIALSAEHKNICAGMEPIWGDGHAAERIRDVLMSCDVAGLLKKPFRDVDFT